MFPLGVFGVLVDAVDGPVLGADGADLGCGWRGPGGVDDDDLGNGRREGGDAPLKALGFVVDNQTQRDLLACLR